MVWLRSTSIFVCWLAAFALETGGTDPGLSQTTTARKPGSVPPGPSTLPDTRPTSRRAPRAPLPSRPPGPVVTKLDIPADFPRPYAIWGAFGTDAAGNVWFGVSAHDVRHPSAHLFELDGRTGKIADRGHVLDQLGRAEARGDGEWQMKIHTRIIQGEDGWLYFASMDENGEDQAREKQPTWGSHLWRIKPGREGWEHVAATKETLIAAGGGGRWIYAMGYFGHVLVQYDVRTGKTRSVKVGSFGGHVSRNFLTDSRGHAYVPRLARDEKTGRAAASLVEFDTDLKEVASTPLEHYLTGSPSGTHGITAFCPLEGGTVAFITGPGRLYLLRPAADGSAKVEDLGWIHPRGESYTASLFTDNGKRLLALSRKDGRYDWLEYDLTARAPKDYAFEVSQPKPASLDDAQLYGSVTRDSAGNFYVGGADGPSSKTYVPILLKISPRSP